MAVSNFQVSQKTKRPACCDFDCCGNHFGRIFRRAHKNHNGNRLVKVRRYAKHVEKMNLKKEILLELSES